MKLLGITMVSNEADVVEAFVRHNLGFLDALVVLDHRSTDRTPQILASLAKEGLPLVVLRDAEPAFRQDQRQTWLAKRFLGELQGDFSFCLDADEFIRCESRAVLEARLAAIDARACALVPLQNYFGVGAEPEAANPVQRLTRRMRLERSQPRKVVLRRDFAADVASRVSFGNHAAIRVAPGRVEPWPHQVLPDVHYAHFPVRSPEQLAKKALLGWLSFRLTQPPAGDGRPGAAPSSHWRALFGRLAAGAPLDESFMREAVAAYAGGDTRTPVDEDELVEDPLGCGYALRYTEPRADPPLAALARWAEQLVVEATTRAPPPSR